MSYRLAIDKCPQCGSDPGAIVERISARAHIMRSERKNAIGLFEYMGESTVCWDSQVPIEYVPRFSGRPLIEVICEMEHSWLTEFSGVK